jgi:hypothetical protein
VYTYGTGLEDRDALTGSGGADGTDAVQ